MEQISSSVCIATVHNNEQISTAKMSNDDAIPLYASIIPSNTRKARWVMFSLNNELNRIQEWKQWARMKNK